MPEVTPFYFSPERITPSDAVLRVDLCVYAATAAGVVAAVTAARRGRSVALLNPSRHVGGMTTGGLSYTDLGNKNAIGGTARRFYQALGQHYGVDEEWCFEPHVAGRQLQAWLDQHDIPVHHECFIDRLDMDGQRIVRAVMLGGLTVEAQRYIDCSYEGDLLPRAGVTYHVGRESNDTYGETLNGVQLHDSHQFQQPVDPYRTPGSPGTPGKPGTPGSPAGGLLPHVSDAELAPTGSGDSLIQAYNFRMCVTDRPDLRVPFAAPNGYDPNRYELAGRWLQTIESEERLFSKFDKIRNGKVDLNNWGAFSTDHIGGNHDYPEAGYQRREAIFQDHVDYQRGLHHFMANDRRVPEVYRQRYATYGLAGDEFTDTGHWPHQLYVREARRLVGDAVMTELSCFRKTVCDDPVGMGAYQMDSHNCQRIVVDGQVKNEGDVQVPLPAPYPISYRSIVPRRGEAENLLVPVCVSASHIAFGSIRMEPVFMILAESAAIAADLSIDRGGPQQELPYDELRSELEAAGQVLDGDFTNRGPGNAGDL